MALSSLSGFRVLRPTLGSSSARLPLPLPGSGSLCFSRGFLLLLLLSFLLLSLACDQTHLPGSNPPTVESDLGEAALYGQHAAKIIFETLLWKSPPWSLLGSLSLTQLSFPLALEVTTFLTEQRVK